MVFSRLSSPQVACVILAAGSSCRMGEHNKLLLPYRGMPMVRQVALQALASNCNRVVVVLGYQPQQIEHALLGLSVQLVRNSNHETGMGSSVVAGALAVPDDEAVIVCLGDMPKVDAYVLNLLIEAYRPQDGVNICQPSYLGKPGNPILWGPAFLPALRRLHGDEGARRVLREHYTEVQRVEVGIDGVLLDVDQPDDLVGVGMRLPHSKDGALAS